MNKGSVRGIFYPLILKYLKREKIWLKGSAIQKHTLRRYRKSKFRCYSGSGSKGIRNSSSDLK